MVVFIDLLGFSMIIPLLPYYARAFGASDTRTGLLLASYAAAQFLGAPLIGRLSDRFGRRPLIIVSLAGTCASFVLLGFAGSMRSLFMSRILCGLFGGNIAVAQAYIADVTDSRHRAKALGFIGAAVGLGFVIGPAVGALLSRRSHEDPAFAAALLSFVDLAAVLLWLPEPPAHPHHGRLLTPRSAAAALVAALRRPFVGPLLWTRFAFFVPFAMFQTIFPLYAMHRFAVTAATTGW